MSDPTELLKAAIYAVKTERNPKRAKILAQQILDDHPASKEAGKARIIIDRLNADAVGAAKKAQPTDTAYTSEEWDGATGKAKGYGYSSDYGVARGLASFFEILGWLVVAGAILLGFEVADQPGVNITGVVISVGGMVLAGLFLIMGAQLVRATVNNADHTGEILAIMKARKV